VVESWRATLEIADDGGSLALDADARSLRVLEGTGGITTLGDDDKAGIAQTIDEEVLKGAAIAFRSRSVAVAGDGLTVEGDLELAGASRPVTFDLAADGGRLTGRAVVRQTDFGIKPYSALFGTLKVADEVEVGVDAPLPTN
jgi:hypothetical protein